MMHAQYLFESPHTVDLHMLVQALVSSSSIMNFSTSEVASRFLI